ncbi:MAG: DUF3179 domain-containing (seleno)protein [Myxococcota bacterium]
MIFATLLLSCDGARRAPSEVAPRPNASRSDTLEGPTAPPFQQGPLDPALARALQTVFGDNLASGSFGDPQFRSLDHIAQSGDVRIAWIVADLLRIVRNPALRARLATALAGLTHLELSLANAWHEATDQLIAWDVPAPPGYLAFKRRIFTLLLPAWDRIFVEGNIDWRHVTWGGVAMDARPFDTTDDPCNCIPATDNPPVTDVAGADWLEDDDIVFGVAVGGEHRAYPRRIMEVREMVNDTLGGRDLAIPYCTLCGSAQAYFTDRLPEGVERPILRTSGLLVRSNKVMFDLETFSVFDTFRGTALTGPLAERGITLPQASVVTARWGEWRRAHPETTVLVERLALGRDFDFRNGRDADGPIFPIGDVDPRLPVQEDVIGVVTQSGRAVAFRIPAVRAALDRGEPVEVENVRVVADGGGFRAVDRAGMDLGAHQAFWFAWSQFHPGTQVWPDD